MYELQLNIPWFTSFNDLPPLLLDKSFYVSCFTIKIKKVDVLSILKCSYCFFISRLERLIQFSFHTKHTHNIICKVTLYQSFNLQKTFFFIILTVPFCPSSFGSSFFVSLFCFLATNEQSILIVNVKTSRNNIKVCNRK